jgi:hypothetical protein
MDSIRNIHFHPARPHTPSICSSAPESAAATAFDPGTARKSAEITRAR